MKIAIASDHAALEMKAALVEYLGSLGHEVDDLGPHDASSVDYPDYGYKLAGAIANGTAERGVCALWIGHWHFNRREPQSGLPAAPAFPSHYPQRWPASIMMPT